MTTARQPPATSDVVKSVHAYWNLHTLGLQYVSDPGLEPGSPEFFAHIRPWMNPYKFPWIMQRIERESRLLRGKRLLEIGCGMGFDSLEFLKRGVRVTAIDLTENAVSMTKRHFEVEGVTAEDVRVGNALALDFPDASFDAVWSNGVLHATGDTRTRDPGGATRAEAGRPRDHLALLPAPVLDVDRAPPGPRAHRGARRGPAGQRVLHGRTRFSTCSAVSKWSKPRASTIARCRSPSAA